MRPSLIKKMKIYAIGTVMGLMGGVVIDMIQPIRWEGEVLVTVGHIRADTQLLEGVQTSIERIKSKSFIQSVVERMKSEPASLVKDISSVGVSARPIRSPNPNGIIITVVANSKEKAEVVANAVTQELLSRHKVIFDQQQAVIRSQLSIIDANAERIEKLMAAAEGRRSDAINAAIIRLQHDLDGTVDRSLSLRMFRNEMTMSQQLEPVSVSERRWFSLAWQAWLFGALLGFLAAFIWNRFNLARVR
jgi:hypothetical protein